MRRRGWIFAVTALLLLLAGQAAAQDDRVSELVIKPFAKGPPWWRVSDGRSTLWIMGMPDGLLFEQKWSDTALRKRLSAASLLISPMLGRPALAEPCGGIPTHCPNIITTIDTRPSQARWFWPNHVLGEVAGATYRTAPLSSRLPADLMARVQAQLRRTNNDKRDKLLNGPTGDVALWLDAWSWPAGTLGNPVVERAQAIATARHMLVVQPVLRPLWLPNLLEADEQENLKLAEDWSTFNLFFTHQPNIRTMPPEAVQQRCLAQALDGLESGALAASRKLAMQAWANGNVEGALKRGSIAQLCLMGDQPASDPLAFWEKRAFAYYQALDQTFSGEKPTQAVALVEFDPLMLAKGGVLEHYRQLGYRIERSDGMDD